MEPLYPLYLDQDYMATPDSDSQGTAPNSNMEREF
jgi:hypothetical protein